MIAEVARDFSRTRDLLEERLPIYHVVYHVHDGQRIPSFAGGMAALVASHSAALRRRLQAVHAITEEEAVHRARLAGKRLRYLLEPIAPHVARGAEVIAQLKKRAGLPGRPARRPRLAGAAAERTRGRRRRGGARARRRRAAGAEEGEGGEEGAS